MSKKDEVRARLDTLKERMPEDEIFAVSPATGIVSLTPKAARLLSEIHFEQAREAAGRVAAALLSPESGIDLPDYVVTNHPE